jgi:hypothetical protein
MTASTNNGNVKVFLPRTFRGKVTQASSNGSLKMSDAMSTHATVFSEARGRRTIFIGDTDPAHASGDNWLGGTVTLESSNGQIKIGWVDEDDEESSGKSSSNGGKKGFLSRFF